MGKTAKTRLIVERGSVLLLTYLSIAIFMGLMIMQTTRSLSSVKQEAKFLDHQQSLNLAEAALDNAMGRMAKAVAPALPATNQALTWCNDGTCNPTGMTCNYNSGGNCTSDLTLTNAGDVATSGKLQANIIGPTTTVASDPMSRVYKIEATGTKPYTNGIKRKITAMAKREPYCPKGLQGNAVTLSFNGMVDSYNSDLGAYSAI